MGHRIVSCTYSPRPTPPHERNRLLHEQLYQQSPLTIDPSVLLPGGETPFITPLDITDEILMMFEQQQRSSPPPLIQPPPQQTTPITEEEDKNYDPNLEAVLIWYNEQTTTPPPFYQHPFFPQ